MLKKMLWLGLMPLSTLFALTIGEVPESVQIDKSNGGLVSGGTWDSASLVDKVHVVFYVDPDEKDLNEGFADRLKKEGFDTNKYATVAIINLAATWKPNIIINALLKKKQKKFPSAVYVKDKNKVLVKRWGLADDNSDILVFDKDGKLLFSKAGKLSEAEMEQAVSLINAHL
jgi:YtfJ family uncharacterized protein